MKTSLSRGGYATQARFANIESPPLERSVFRRAAGHKTTFNEGLLIPIYWDEVLPGDTIKLKSNFLVRLATPLYPYMDNVYLDVHYFFVPNRLVWTNFQKFMGEQEDPGDSTDFLTPQLDDATHATGFAEGSIYDYLGLPTKVASVPQSRMPNAFIMRAYNMIWNEWFRDQNLQNSVPVDKTDGPDTTTYTLLPRGRRKDYFTSALPWPQKGPDVLLPIGSSAPVYGNVLSDAGSSYFDKTLWQGIAGSAPGVIRYGGVTGQASSPYSLNKATPPGSSSGWDSSVVSGFGLATAAQYAAANAASGGGANGTWTPPFADLSAATASTINQIREAFQLQKLFERDARGGTRYVEILLSHFGVISPDFRLQRPEFLGAGTFNLNVNPVEQTSASTEGGTPQGELAAYAVANGRSGFNHSFVEHGHVIGLISVRAETTYQQGMHRAFSRRTRYDFYWPSFAHLGEQEILNKEIYMDGSANDDEPFGFNERYAEYRFRASMVTGLFRSNATASLDSWHLAVDFTALPTLGSIIPETPPIERIVAVPSEHHFICDSWHEQMHARPMPAYSTPGLVDHF